MRSGFPLLAIVFLLAVAGCEDDGHGPAPAPPAMAAMWPHADGSSWSYEQSEQEFVTDGPPPWRGDELPAMEVLHADLARTLSGPPGSLVSSVIYTLTFDGTITTRSGVEARNLKESFTGKDAFSRPLPTKSLYAYPPMFLQGGAFAFEDSGFYRYGDLDSGHAWTYLEGELRTGRDFSVQITPVLADDHWLHGRIWSVRTRTIDGVRYRNVVECMYVLDGGLRETVDETSNVVGYERDFGYARIFFAPEVGPVYVQERFWGPRRTAYAPHGTGEYYIRETECRLADHHLAEP